MNIARSFSAVVSSLLVAALVACAPTAKRAGTGEYIDDTVITGKVKAALIADLDLKATEINVETFKGTVQLSGFVSSPAHIPRAVDLVRRIDGVQAVKNDIALKR